MYVAAPVTAVQVSAGNPFVGVGPVSPFTWAGALASITTATTADGADSLPAASTATIA